MAKAKKNAKAMIKQVLSSTVVLIGNTVESKPKIKQFYTINSIYPEDETPDESNVKFLVNVCSADNQILATYAGRTYDHAVSSLSELLTKYLKSLDVSKAVRLAVQQFSLRSESVLSDKTVIRMMSLEVGENIKYVVSYAADEHWPPHLNIPEKECAFHDTLHDAEQMYQMIVANDYIKSQHKANDDNPHTN